jgi:hypothetical protein
MDTVAACWWTNAVTEPITGTPEPELYRYGYHAKDFWVNLTIGPGQYTVRLRFAATRGMDTQANRFNIHLNGREVAHGFDVATTAGGPNKATNLVFHHISPRNGAVEIRFTAASFAEGGTADSAEAFAQALEVVPQ